MPAQQVASLYGTVDLRDNVSDGLRNITNQFNTLGSGMQRLGTQVSAMSLPLAGLYGAGLSAASGFQNVMTQLETFGGLAGAELEAVRQTALQLGADTMFSATDAANAMLELVKSGMSVEEAMNGANAAMSLAAVSGLGMEESAGILATTLNNFNLDPITGATVVVDALTKAANISTADVNDMAQA